MSEPLTDGQIEQVRKIAWELFIDNMHFHELAMARPFKAEAYVQDAGKRLLNIVGYPRGVKVLTPNELAARVSPGKENE